MAIEAAQTGWSADGNWFWDGARWNDAVSEDGKWRSETAAGSDRPETDVEDNA